jgi:hypothetical protein
MKTIECWYVEPWTADFDEEFPDEGVWYPEWDRGARFSTLEEALKYAESLTRHSKLILTKLSDQDNVPAGTDYAIVHFEKFTVYDSFEEFRGGVV